MNYFKMFLRHDEKKPVSHLESRGKFQMVAKQECEKSLLPTTFCSVLMGFGKGTWQQEQIQKDCHSVADK